MNEKVEAAKITISSLLAIFITAAEEYISIKLIFLLLLLMFFDTLMGWAKARKAGEWESFKARWGILGKVFELSFVAIAHGLDWILGTEILMQAFIVYFCLVEIGSLMENAHAIGVPIPKEAVGMAINSKHFFGWFFVERLKEFIAFTFKMDYKDIKRIAEEKQEEEKQQAAKEQEERKNTNKKESEDE